MTDAEAVTRFEAFVQHQQPAPVWTPVTPYDFESRKLAEGKHPALILETFQPRVLLDYGCGFGTLLRLLNEEQPTWAHRFEGYDPNSQQFTTLPYGPYDLVICREVLEHCTVLEAVQVVRRLVRLSSKFVYVTTRFAKQPDHFLSVETEFDADPTHITCLTKPFLRTLFVLEGCKSRPDLEAQMDWQRKGRCLVFEVPSSR